MSPNSRPPLIAPRDDLSRRQFLTTPSAGSLVRMARSADGQVSIGATELATQESFRPDLYVAIARDGAVTILAHRSDMGTGKVWASIDAGIIVNPDRVRAQIEGAAVMAATQALFGGVSFKSGRTVETNFNRYKMLRMHNAPREVFVDIVDSQAAPAGVGEIGVPSFAPALCNAIFSAVGVRIRNLPVLTPQGKWRTPYLRQQSAD